MSKSIVAAVGAAAILAFGAVGSAVADTEISGFADIKYNALDTDAEEGNFLASGEIDLVHSTDAGSLRIDLDILNALNTSAQADVPSGTGTLGVDVEQLVVTIPVNGMISIDAGIMNSPLGKEGQDAPDIHFAKNGMLWDAVPSNIVGGMLTVSPNEMITLQGGFINEWTDAAQAGPTKDNGFIIAASVMPAEGIGVNIAYLTSVDDDKGDLFNINASAAVMPGLELGVQFQVADPSSASVVDQFDSGFGIDVAYTMDKLTGAIRYESATFDGAAVPEDETELSIAISHECSENATLRVDWTNHDVDNGGTTDTATIQYVYAY